MNYDAWKTTPPDDNPEGEPDHDDRCPSCGAFRDEECSDDCLCGACEKLRAKQSVADLSGDAA